MKLLFPNGEHAQVMLNDGVSRIGSAADCQVVLDLPGIEARHCEIELNGMEARVRPLDGAAVSVNGAQVSGEVEIRAGDRMALAEVQLRLAGVERAAAPAPRAAAPVDDTGATRLRMALPKYILRGVSGAAFGKTFPVGKEMIIGRQQDSDIPIPAEEISRHHAKVKPTADGLMVEDMGSANGTYINGKRVQQGVLKAGDELRLDSIRFMLIAPGQEIKRESAAEAPASSAPAASGGSKAPMIIGVLVVLGIAAAAGWYFLGR